MLTKFSPASPGGAGGCGRELLLPAEPQLAGLAGLARTHACTHLHTLAHMCILTHCSWPHSPQDLPIAAHIAGGTQGPDPAPVLEP